MIVINGISYVLVNVLLMLMQAAGPTPVAGTSGTTAAFLHGTAGGLNHSVRAR